MKSKPKVVDLFCGCGGFGLGAEMAGFHTEVAIDVDETLQSAYRKNFPNTKVLQVDLSIMEKKDWDKILGDVQIDGVIGGPPCQGYSRIGAGDISDPRRLLIMDFFRHVNSISPKFFIMENVEGLMDGKNIVQLRKAIASLDKKYKVLQPIIVDASEYGAPTKRKRVIVVGFDPKKLSFQLSVPYFTPPNISVTVKDAIEDIGEPINEIDDENHYGWSAYRPVKKISEYAKAMRRSPPKGLGCSEAIKYLKQGKVSGNFDTIHSEEVSKRYKSIYPGKVDPVSRSKKLTWNGLCPTLRAGTGSDKGSYQSVRPLHPAKGRVITVREAARLQGFPDWFCFHNTKWHSFRMIGNSVSPIVSEAILSKIQLALKCEDAQAAA